MHDFKWPIISTRTRSGTIVACICRRTWAHRFEDVHAYTCKPTPRTATFHAATTSVLNDYSNLSPMYCPFSPAVAAVCFANRKSNALIGGYLGGFVGSVQLGMHSTTYSGLMLWKKAMDCLLDFPAVSGGGITTRWRVETHFSFVHL